MQYYIWALIVLLSVIGCSQKSSTDSQRSNSSTESKASGMDGEAKKSWKKFVERSKGRIDQAVLDSEGKVADRVKVDWLSDDVKKSLSVKYPYEGIIQIKSVHILGDRHRDYKHTIRFGYEDGKWVVVGAQEENSQGSFERDGLRYIYLKTLFGG